MTEAPKNIWLQIYREVKQLDNSDLFMVGVTWSHKKVADDDIKYIRADRYTALLEAAVSLADVLWRVVSVEVVTSELLEDAHLSHEKWNRFLDGKTEEE